MSSRFATHHNLVRVIHGVSWQVLKDTYQDPSRPRRPRPEGGNFQGSLRKLLFNGGVLRGSLGGEEGEEEDEEEDGIFMDGVDDDDYDDDDDDEDDDDGDEDEDGEGKSPRDAARQVPHYLGPLSVPI